MHGDNIFKILNVLCIWTGVALIISGISRMNESGYTPPNVPAGWVLGMAWITVAGIIMIIYVMHITTLLIVQKIKNEYRWTMTKIGSYSMIILAAVSIAVVGTYYTWKHPYRIGDCGCREDEWGLQCTACQCVNGKCHSGIYGTGTCSCDFGWGGATCNVCDNRHKPEGVCDTCKTGFAGDKCQFCAVGYTGENCDLCDTGWKPWQHSSKLFPNTIAADDGRHLCDECADNHWGYYCKSCPVGNDVPKMTLTKNNPIEIGVTRVTSKLSGVVQDLRNFNPQDPFVLRTAQLKIKYDYTNRVSDWIYLKDVKGFQCNNRGTCRDDKRMQELTPFEWNAKCTPTYDECTTNNDCSVSQNCKGTCQGTEFPVNAIWSLTTAGNICSSNEECRGPAIGEDSNGVQYYVGGQCVNRMCCKETYHGDGNCECNPSFFGEDVTLHTLSPACDFCPGYDWTTEESTTICSGGKGTCSPSYGASSDPNVRGDYLKMRCTCGKEVYADPETGILDESKIISWSGKLCECGDMNEDGRCDFCASGHWGKECLECPGGGGARACSGHGTCDSGVYGTGICTCDVDRTSSWMLADYIPRYEGDCDKCGSIKEDKRTCNECAPNFFGEQCLRCDYTDMVKADEINNIFQPIGSFSTNQSPAKPHSVCHPQQTWLCTLACSGGGWCDWGRRGTGTCMCWSNKRQNDATWNPLDNVCVGNNRHNPDTPYDGTNEQCPSEGWCDVASSRTNFEECGKEFFTPNKNMQEQPVWDPSDDWSGAEQNCPNGQTCNKWRAINWRPSNSRITCKKENN
jgi:hypothetical protein